MLSIVCELCEEANKFPLLLPLLRIQLRPHSFAEQILICVYTDDAAHVNKATTKNFVCNTQITIDKQHAKQKALLKNDCLQRTHGRAKRHPCCVFDAHFFHRSKSTTTRTKISLVPTAKMDNEPMKSHPPSFAFVSINFYFYIYKSNWIEESEATLQHTRAHTHTRCLVFDSNLFDSSIHMEKLWRAAIANTKGLIWKWLETWEMGVFVGMYMYIWWHWFVLPCHVWADIAPLSKII